MHVPLDYDEWYTPAGPVDKWIVQSSTAADLAKDDEVYFAANAAGTIKIKNVVCIHGGIHSGASWKGVILTGGTPAGPKVTGKTKGSAGMFVNITSSHPGYNQLDCNVGTTAVGAPCWTASDGG